MDADQTLRGAVSPHEWFWVGGVTLALIVLGMLLLGIPGAVFLEVSRGFLKIDPQNCLGAGVWPLAIVATLLTPFGVPLGYLIARAALPGSKPGRIVLTLAVYLVLGLLFSSWFYINAQNSAAKSSTARPECKPYRWPYGS